MKSNKLKIDNDLKLNYLNKGDFIRYDGIRWNNTQLISVYSINESTYLTNIKTPQIRIIALSPTEEFNVYLPQFPIQEEQLVFIDSIGSDFNIPTGLGLFPVVINGNGKTIQGHDSIILDVENCSLSIIYTNNRWNIINASY